MRVLVADAFEESGLTALKAAGCDVLYQPDLKDAALADAIRTVHAGRRAIDPELAADAWATPIR